MKGSHLKVLRIWTMVSHIISLSACGESFLYHKLLFIDIYRPCKASQSNAIYSGGKKNPDLRLFYKKNEQMRVKRSNKSRNTVTMYLKYNMHSCYCGFLTLPSFFENLGMLSGRFYTSQTLDILPKMPLICCCKTGNDKAWHHILCFHYGFNL